MAATQDRISHTWFCQKVGGCVCGGKSSRSRSLTQSDRLRSLDFSATHARTVRQTLVCETAVCQTVWMWVAGIKHGWILQDSIWTRTTYLQRLVKRYKKFLLKRKNTIKSSTCHYLHKELKALFFSSHVQLSNTTSLIKRFAASLANLVVS